MQKKIENDRFVFLSKESLKLTIDNFQSDGIENVEQEFKKLYEKGFRSHKPILGSQNEQLRAKFTEEILSRRENSKSSTTYYRNTGSTEDEEAEEFISDPLLASLVNENNEIIVNDTLYKFTKEKGVYFAHINDSTYLLNYFEGEFESNAQLTIDIESERELYGGYTDVDEKIGRFVRPNLQHAPLNEGSSGGLSSGPIPQLLNEEQLNDIVNNLPVCDGNASGNWFQNIFGTSYVCRSYFSDTRRIKTEFWDQNWGIYKSVGILTKTQKKTLGIWWASDSDEIHLGINHILLRYNFPQPQISSYSHPQLFPVNSYKKPIYMWDGKFKIDVQNNGYLVNTLLNLPDGKLPFFDFGNDQILNIYIPKLYESGRYNLNLTTQDITSQSNIKELYKMGIDFLNSPEVANSGASNKVFAVTYQKDNNNIEVIYFAERYQKNDDHRIKELFYSDVGFLISWAWSDSPQPIYTTEYHPITGIPSQVQVGTDYSGTSNFSISVADDYFRDYTHYELDFYGMARRGSAWKGNRMIR